jgi:hypothetical protein
MHARPYPPAELSQARLHCHPTGPPSPGPSAGSPEVFRSCRSCAGRNCSNEFRPSIHGRKKAIARAGKITGIPGSPRLPGRVCVRFLLLFLHGGDPLVQGCGPHRFVLLRLFPFSVGIRSGLHHHGDPPAKAGTQTIPPAGRPNRGQLRRRLLLLSGRALHVGGRSQYPEHDLSHLCGDPCPGSCFAISAIRWPWPWWRWPLPGYG